MAAVVAVGGVVSLVGVQRAAAAAPAQTSVRRHSPRAVLHGIQLVHGRRTGGAAAWPVASSSRTCRMARRSLVVHASTATDTDAQALNEKFGVKDSVIIDEGQGGLTRVTLKHASGSSAELYLYGACVTSWVLPKVGDVLYVRPDAVFTGKKPISGGIPHCFPQFGPGAMQQHGFARNLNWEIASTSADVNPDEPEPSIELTLTDNEYTRAMFDYSFRAVYSVTLQPTRLRCDFRIVNTDTKPFDFTAALHTYFAANIADVAITGLKGCKTLNKVPDPTNPKEDVEVRDVVTITDMTDCIYVGSPAEVTLETGKGPAIGIQSKGWEDTVVWNPNTTMDCYKEFVCVEAGKVVSPQTVLPGTSWSGEMVLTPY
eukprot:jgi/Chlat1/6016/Chrsp4S06197